MPRQMWRKLGHREKFKFVSLLLETQVDRTRHFCECCSKHGRRYHTDGRGANRARMRRITVAKYMMSLGCVFAST
jgi:hypothetical protein